MLTTRHLAGLLFKPIPNFNTSSNETEANYQLRVFRDRDSTVI